MPKLHFNLCYESSSDCSVSTFWYHEKLTDIDSNAIIQKRPQVSAESPIFVANIRDAFAQALLVMVYGSFIRKNVPAVIFFNCGYHSILMLRLVSEYLHTPNLSLKANGAHEPRPKKEAVDARWACYVRYLKRSDTCSTSRLPCITATIRIRSGSSRYTSR